MCKKTMRWILLLLPGAALAPAGGAYAQEEGPGEPAAVQPPEEIPEDAGAPAGSPEAFRGERYLFNRLDLKGAKVVDAIQLISEVSGLNVVATAEAATKEVTLNMQEVNAAQAVEVVCKVAGLWYRRDEDTQTFRIMTTEEYQKDHIVYRKDEIEIFTLQYPNAITVATAIEDLFGERVYLSLGIEDEEVDTMGGLIRGRYGSAFGASSSQYGFNRDYGSGSGRYSRSGGMYGSGRYSRSSGGGRGSYGYQGYGRGAGMRGSVDSEEVVEDTLTAEQLSLLQERLGEAREAEAEDLVGITRKDPPIYVTVNRQQNVIVVRTSDGAAMDDIERLIADLDRPTPQVLLEMKILELSLGDSFRSIFDVQWTTGKDTTGPEDTQPANPLDPAAATSPRYVTGLGNFDLEPNTLVYQFLNSQVRARIQLLAQDGRVEVLSTPVLLASNNRPAHMFVGEERVLTTGARTDTITPATGAATTYIEPITEVRDVGNTLIIIPKINADRTVTLLISQDNSTVDEDSASIPIVDGNGNLTDYPIDTVLTANLQVSVVAKDNKTLVIGGLVKLQNIDAHERVPILGDIPLLGLLFQRTEIRHEKRELLLLVTPRVIFTPAEAEQASRERVEALSRHRYFDGLEEKMDRHYDRVEKRLEDRLYPKVQEMIRHDEPDKEPDDPDEEDEEQ